MDIDDPYCELGLTAEATDAQVKAAWRRLSARWHPDRNTSPQALERIQRINRALEAIRNARGRLDDGAPAAPSAAQDAEGRDDAIEHEVSLSLEEAACGCIRSVSGAIAQTCSACSGRGMAAEPVVCAACGGQGQVRQALWFPWLTTAVTCTACEGRGASPAPCTACDGSGQAEPLTYRSRLRIPPGVRDGHQLQARVKLQGRDAHQWLDVRITVRPHEFMALQADGTVQVEVPVDGFAWVAGHWIDVPTPYGLRQMRLQRGALTYRIQDAGLPTGPGHPRADCLVSVVPLFPAEWSARQEALLQQLVQSNTADAGTEAGVRARAWEQTLAAWRERQQAHER